MATLLGDWGWYYKQLGMLVQANQPVTEGGVPPGDENDPEIVKQLEKLYNRDLNGDGVIGQAGQVSQMLTPIHTGNISAAGLGSIPQVPSVGGGRSRGGVHEIKLSGDVSGLDPYIQRILVAGLLEIERNRD